MPDRPARLTLTPGFFVLALVAVLPVGVAAVTLWDVIANQERSAFCDPLVLMEFKSVVKLICEGQNREFWSVSLLSLATVGAGLAFYGACRAEGILLRRDPAGLFRPKNPIELERLLQFKDADVLDPAQAGRLESLRRRVAGQALQHLEQAVDAAGAPPDPVAREARRRAVDEIRTAEETDEIRALARIADGDITGGLDLLTAVADDSSQDPVAVWRRIGELAYDLDTRRARVAYEKVVALGDARPWDRIFLIRLLVRSGDLAVAKQHAKDLLATAKILSDRDRSVAYTEIGEIQQAQGDLVAALDSYRAGLAIAERLAASDPSDTVWQRDLSVSYETIGDGQQAQGDLAAALDSFRAGLEIRQRLASSDPSDTGWQRDLSISYEKIGNIQQAQGDLVAALDSYRTNFAILERLAASDPSNTVWQRDRTVSLWKLADLPGSGVPWRAVVARLEAMDARGILQPSDRQALTEARRRAAADSE